MTAKRTKEPSVWVVEMNGEPVRLCATRNSASEDMNLLMIRYTQERWSISVYRRVPERAKRGGKR